MDNSVLICYKAALERVAELNETITYVVQSSRQSTVKQRSFQFLLVGNNRLELFNITHEVELWIQGKLNLWKWEFFLISPKIH